MGGVDWFPNYAKRDDVDDKIIQELKQAGITYTKMPESLRKYHSEMRTVILGVLFDWSFSRNWNYWVAKGPGIPPEYANKLHEKYGKLVRVDGHCDCPSPFERFKGFAVSVYHVDTFSGLNALADTIRLVIEDAKK